MIDTVQEYKKLLAGKLYKAYEEIDEIKTLPQGMNYEYVPPGKIYLKEDNDDRDILFFVHFYLYGEIPIRKSNIGKNNEIPLLTPSEYEFLNRKITAEAANQRRIDKEIIEEFAKQLTNYLTGEEK